MKKKKLTPIKKKIGGKTENIHKFRGLKLPSTGIKRKSRNILKLALEKGIAGFEHIVRAPHDPHIWSDVSLVVQLNPKKFVATTLWKALDPEVPIQTLLVMTVEFYKKSIYRKPLAS